MKRALVTGSRGQDGSYLTELLEGRGYEVVGVERGDVDLADAAAVTELVEAVRPDEIYNLAAASFVADSWDDPRVAIGAGAAVVALLEAIRLASPAARLLQASSVEVFGSPLEVPQRESTPYAPQSLYGAAKAFCDFAVRAYRDRYRLHVSSAILYNHESPRRRAEFLPAKVAHGAVAIAEGRSRELRLGDLDARRDWGYAPDYVEAMWRMLQQPEPDDFVIATGELHTVRELVEVAFARLGLDWRQHVRVDESLVRGDDRPLVGDASKARSRLGWAPTISFEQLVHLLVDAARRG